MTVKSNLIGFVPRFKRYFVLPRWGQPGNEPRPEIGEFPSIRFFKSFCMKSNNKYFTNNKSSDEKLFQ